MQLPKEIIRLRTEPGTPVVIGDRTITPLAQTLVVRWPMGGFAWSRPLAVLVEQGGKTDRIPIVDLAQVARLGMLAAGLTAGVALALRGRGKDSREEE